MNLAGIALGGMVDQNNLLRELAQKNRALDLQQRGLDINQQNADTARLGVQNTQLQFQQKLALQRMDTTLLQLQKLKANLNSPADLPSIKDTLAAGLHDIAVFASASGGNPQVAIRYATNAIAATPTVSEAATNKGNATAIENTIATPSAAALAGAQEAARAANAAPQVIASVSDKGHQILTFVHNGQVGNQIDLGAVKGNLDLGKFRANLALRSQGKTVDDPQVQSLTPNEALATSNVLSTANPINSFVSGLLGGGGNPAATGGAPKVNDSLVSSYFTRIAKGGKISGAEWGALNPAEQSELNSLVGNLKGSAPQAPAASPGLGGSPLGNLANPQPAAPLAQ